MKDRSASAWFFVALVCALVTGIFAQTEARFLAMPIAAVCRGR